MDSCRQFWTTLNIDVYAEENLAKFLIGQNFNIQHSSYELVHIHTVQMVHTLTFDILWWTQSYTGSQSVKHIVSLVNGWVITAILQSWIQINLANSLIACTCVYECKCMYSAMARLGDQIQKKDV